MLNEFFKCSGTYVNAHESLHPFVDHTGAEVKTAFLDYELYFPEGDGQVQNDKKTAAAKLEITITPSNDSVITPQFIDAVLDRSDFLIEKSNVAWVDGHKNLQPFTNDEYKNLMKDFGAYFEEMKSQHLTERDIEHARKILETAKGNNQFKKDDNGDPVDSSATIEEVPESRPEKENTSVQENVKVDSDLLNMDI